MDNNRNFIFNDQQNLFLFLAKRAGLDMKTFWDCIRASAGNSFVWETGGPMVMQGTYDPSFTIDLQSKDNQLGYDMAKKYKVSKKSFLKV